VILEQIEKTARAPRDATRSLKESAMTLWMSYSLSSFPGVLGVLAVYFRLA